MTLLHRFRFGVGRRMAALGTAAAAFALLFTAAPAAVAAPAPAPAALTTTWGDFTCDGGLYRIKAPTPSDLALTVALSPGNHGSVIQYVWTGESNQKWIYCHRPEADGTETVVFQDSWRHWCLAVGSDATFYGAWIVTTGCFSDHIPTEQQFVKTKVPGTNLFALQGQHSRLWVTASGTFGQNGNQITQGDRPDLYSLLPA
ncbi:RICIN domain-containing protein [Kitasatospora sp. NPDC058218]|uniref:RICIN domain-containing protein n=1 Tax=Kitasatospora sp. NPDC058218 TaxID=3346385 RepID=UPI0036DD9540